MSAFNIRSMKSIADSTIEENDGNESENSSIVMSDINDEFDLHDKISEKSIEDSIEIDDDFDNNNSIKEKKVSSYTVNKPNTPEKITKKMKNNGLSQKHKSLPMKLKGID